jgi:hypothetical protein
MEIEIGILLDIVRKTSGKKTPSQTIGLGHRNPTPIEKRTFSLFGVEEFIEDGIINDPQLYFPFYLQPD